MKNQWIASLFGRKVSPAKAEVIDEISLLDGCMAHLKERGFSPKINDDGAIHFKLNGGNYLLVFDKEDATFLRLIYPSFWSIESSDDRSRVIRAAVMTNGEIKSVKLYLNQDEVMGAVEFFCATPDDFKLIFRRCLRALEDGVDTFQLKMSKNK